MTFTLVIILAIILLVVVLVGIKKKKKKGPDTGTLKSSEKRPSQNQPPKAP